MKIFHSDLGILHTIFASFALIFGTIVLFIQKGNKRHKQIGYAYVASMLLVNFSSFGLQWLFKGFGFFHIMALVSLATIALGLIPMYLKKPSALEFHKASMYYSVLGLYAAFFAEVGVRIPYFRTNMWFWIVVFGTMFLTFFIGGSFFKRKYKNWALLILFGLTTLNTNAQSNFYLGNHFSVLGSENSFGVQGSWQKPHFGIKLQANLTNIKGREVVESPEVENRFGLTQLSFEGGGYILDHIRVYGGGGPMIAFGTGFADSNIRVGGFGFYGFGFRAKRVEYFLEAGGGGGFGNASKLVGQPLFGTGFYLSVGQRIRLGGG